MKIRNINITIHLSIIIQQFYSTHKIKDAILLGNAGFIRQEEISN